MQNVVDGTLRACTATDVAGRVINVSCGDRVSLNTLYQLMRERAGGGPDPEFAPARVGDVRDSQADIALARELLGYRPFVALEEGLARTMAWYRNEEAQPAT